MKGENAIIPGTDPFTGVCESAFALPTESNRAVGRD
jgi:hypothetical protein